MTPGLNGAEGYRRVSGGWDYTIEEWEQAAWDSFLYGQWRRAILKKHRWWYEALFLGGLLLAAAVVLNRLLL